MASILNGFWHGAARLSGRVDWSEALRMQEGPLDEMTSAELERAGIGHRQRKILRDKNPIRVDSGCLLISNAAYPPALRHLPHAPAVLFFEGNSELLSETCISVVGARKCTQRAKDFTHKMATSLADSGLVIVSGLAYGVDYAAHKACLSRTIAVLGQGINSAYTGSKARFIREIVDAGGLVLSEFPPYVSASKHTFPQRNRVIAGLSIATIVVEASMRSGSRITARLALEYGREVMAVPGHPFDPHSRGCNQLIKEGALLIQDASDVRDCLGIQIQSTAPIPPETQIAKQILSEVNGPVTIDQIFERTGIAMPTLLMAIESLELTGWIQRLSGDRIATRIKH